MHVFAMGDAQGAPLAICQVDLQADRTCFAKLVVHPDYRNVGVAKAVLSLIRETLEPLCDRIFAVTSQENVAGQNLIKTANFHKTSGIDQNGNPVYVLDLNSLTSRPCQR